MSPATMAITPVPASSGGLSEADARAEDSKALYRSLAASVAVVTADAGHGPLGMTASSVMAVSLDPPLMLVSLAHQSGTLASIVTAGRFAVNLLTEDQEALAARFAGPRPGWVRFNGVDLESEHPPVLAAGLAGCVCAVEWVQACGDHVLVLGRIEQQWTGPGGPLVWHRSGYHRIARPA